MTKHSMTELQNSPISYRPAVNNSTLITVVILRGKRSATPHTRLQLTLRKNIPVEIPVRKKKLATIFGSRNGNLIKRVLLPNSAGMFSAGFAKKPPNDGPKIEPKLHTRGMMENALEDG